MYYLYWLLHLLTNSYSLIIVLKYKTVTFLNNYIWSNVSHFQAGYIKKTILFFLLNCNCWKLFYIDLICMMSTGCKISKEIDSRYQNAENLPLNLFTGLYKWKQLLSFKKTPTNRKVIQRYRHIAFCSL